MIIILTFRQQNKELKTTTEGSIFAPPYNYMEDTFIENLIRKLSLTGLRQFV